jgi:hypothetical protein
VNKLTSALLWCYVGVLRLVAWLKSWFVDKPVAVIKKVKRKAKKK